MTKKYFGTDGIRGAVHSQYINGDMFFKFGLASGTYFKSQKKRKQTAIIAKDTRLSGYTLEPALVSGLASAGMHVYTLGPLPTNGLAMLTKEMKANMGIMITASHNPHYDNGLKLFGPDGMKLSDKIEKKIEGLIDKKISKNLSHSEKLGRVKRLETGTTKYIKILKKNFTKEFNLRGLRIVIDCANGAGYKAGPELLRSLGAKVIAIGVNPNGLNINSNCAYFHKVAHDYTGTEIENVVNQPALGQNQFFIQTLGGINGRMTIPSFDSLIAKPVIINKAEIILPFEDYLYDDYPSPSSLFLSRKNVEGEYEFLPDLFEGSLGGNFNVVNKNYTFNITRHLNEIVAEKAINDTIKIFPNGNGITANRVVLNGMNSTKKDKAKVVISYTKY